MATCVFPVSQALREHYGEGASTKFVDYAQVDAFTAEAFKGNPAVVCLLPIARSEEWMQNVAAEFNAPMAVFLVNRSSLKHGMENGQDTMNGESTVSTLSNSYTNSQEKACEYDVRFFTPLAEVDICGHGTLASAYLMFKSGLAQGSSVVFHTNFSVVLKVNKIMDGNGSKEWQGKVELILPFMDTTTASTNMESIFPRTLQGCKVVSSHKSVFDRVILELPSAKDVETLKPCFEEIAASSSVLIVTGKGSTESPFDFVSRFFAPQFGVPEDPVCGTAHCAIAPLWAAKLGKEKLLAYQASKRGGVLELVVDSDAKLVKLRGTAVIVATGVLQS